ncbi:carboxypeptidase regulatory-like domain-containing protein [Alienimonas chondri]|uniref:Carboxypeptidase regulatory-like domain-containing protein n=1 Tax=Alienimonas chondri TaxID=2681879 RepID=A0ABX1VHM4_9PLAN|nr:carboxypeptidase regulatory-like domain-containing protein [Alienimonas chondri]NNJ27581.1 hypothetical protein [Alienimonas chondri]
MPRSLLTRFLAPATAFAAAALLCPAAVHAAGYGDVKGQIVLDGEAPDLAPRVAKGADVTKDGKAVKDAAVCAADPIPDFSLVVGPTNGIANVFLYPARAPRDIKPGLMEEGEKVVFDQNGCVFEPHALIVRTDQTLVLKSNDTVAHNVRFTSFGNAGINKTVAAEDRVGVELDKFKRAQPVPIPALCDFHPWMKANWLIVDHPYAAITDADGNFTIEGLPEGTHRFTVWHESAGFLDRTLTIKIEDGEVTELEPMKYELSKFKL